MIPVATASIQDADTRSAQQRARADSAGSVAPKSLSLQPFPTWICRQSHANVDAHAAARAHDVALDVDRRAGILIAVAPRLRAKQAPKIVAALLADDAVTASSRLAGMTDRSLRRLLERLVALGAARELTGRATSRLYGL